MKSETITLISDDYIIADDLFFWQRNVGALLNSTFPHFIKNKKNEIQKDQKGLRQ